MTGDCKGSLGYSAELSFFLELPEDFFFFELLAERCRLLFFDDRRA